MTREELSKALEELPKVKTSNPISAMNTINVDDLMNAVDRFNKIPNYNDLLKENEKLKEQVDYLRSNEYLNQLRFERDVLQDIANKGKISKEDKDFIDCTHRNTELLEENQKLKKQYSERTDCSGRLGTSKKVEALEKENEELKKQVEEWKHHLKCSKEMLDIQGQKGNYDYDEYMLGLYNGMEYIIALFETREPNYINGADVNFTNSKSQQKEFIKFLEDNWKETQDIWYIKVLNKYKEIIGDYK